jgi:TonB family protein
MAYRRSGLLLLFLFLLTVSASQAENTRKDIKKQLEKIYKGKAFIIRNFYDGNRLKYDSEGTLVSGGKPGSWTLDGHFQIEKIQLRKDKIELQGKRLCWSYNPATGMQKFSKDTNQTVLEIKLTPDSPDPARIQKALTKVFLAKGETLADHVPPYWASIIRADFKGPIIRKSPACAVPQILGDDTLLPYREGQDVVYPKVVYNPIPPYTRAARQLRLEGIILVSAVIDKEGHVEVRDIISPLGAGLDDIAAETIGKWKFEPGLLNGNPVGFLTHLEVSYRLFNDRFR